MKLSIILALTLFSISLSPLLNAADERPNLLFIITDDMFPHYMDFMPEGDGRNHTPNLDRLAAEGTLMRGQYVSSTVCTPSRYSVLSGRYASRSQAPDFIQRLGELGQTHVEWNTFINPENERSVAHYLSEAGYRTGFVGKDHVAWTPGHVSVGLASDPKDPKVHTQMLANYEASRKSVRAIGFEYAESIYYNNPDWNGSMQLSVHNQDWITKGAIDFIESDDERPFFLYFATTLPHGPGAPERSWKADRRATPIGWIEDLPKVQPGIESIAKRASENNAVGRENLTWVDDAVGVLLEKLEATGKLDNTIIFFFNDHGQSAKGSIYQKGVYNPSFVWRKGGWPVGKQSNALVSNIDFAATLLDFAEAPPAESVDGISFAPILRGEADKTHEVLFFEMGYTRGVLYDNFKYIALRYPEKIANLSLEEKQANLDYLNQTLIDREREPHNYDVTKPMGHLMPIPGGHDTELGAMSLYPNYNDPDQLYNLAVDPDEQINLVSNPEYAQKLAEMKQLLTEHLKTLPGGFEL